MYRVDELGQFYMILKQIGYQVSYLHCKVMQVCLKVWAWLWLQTILTSNLRDMVTSYGNGDSTIVYSAFENYMLHDLLVRICPFTGVKN